MSTAMPSADGPEVDRGEKGGVRTALAGLTTRGRSFFAAGIAAAICAYILGQSDLLRVGLMLAVLPLVCATVLYRTRYRVAGSRRLSPARVPAGSEARVHLRMDNVSRLPTGLLMLQDRVPYVLRIEVVNFDDVGYHLLPDGIALRFDRGQHRRGNSHGIRTGHRFDLFRIDPEPIGQLLRLHDTLGENPSPFLHAALLLQTVNIRMPVA